MYSGISFGKPLHVRNVHLEPSANEPSSSVVHGFYDDAVVLITGGTGFIGKVLVEKLLRSFRIRRLYLLIRAKNARSVDERLAEFFEESVRTVDGVIYCVYTQDLFTSCIVGQIFDRVRFEKPGVFAKVAAINTDFEAPDLRIDPQQRVLLENDVEVCAHINHICNAHTYN